MLCPVEHSDHLDEGDGEKEEGSSKHKLNRLISSVKLFICKQNFWGQFVYSGILSVKMKIFNC